MAEQIAKKLQFSFSQYLKTADGEYVQVPISNSQHADNEFVVDVDPRHLKFDIRRGPDYATAAAAAGQPFLQPQFEVYHPDAADDRKDNPVRRLRRIVEIDVDSKDESIEAQEFQALNDFGRDVLLTWTPPREAESQLQTLGIEMKRLDQHSAAQVEMALTHREALFLQLGLERAYPDISSEDTKYDGVLGAVEKTSRGMYDYLKSIKDRTTEFQNAAAKYQQHVANGLRDNLARYAVKQSTGLDVRVPAKRGGAFANIKAALWDDLGTTFLSDVESNGGVPADTIKAAAAAGTAAFVFAPFAAAGAAVLGVATGVSYLGLSAWAGASVANELANSHRIVGSGLAEQFILNGFTDTLVRNPIDAAFSGYVMYRMHTDVDSRTTAFRQRVKDFESEVAKAKENHETLPDLANFLSNEIKNLKQEEPELGKALEAKKATTAAELGDELEKQLKTDLADQLRDVDRSVGYYSALMFRQRGTWSLIDGLDYVQGIKLSGVALATSASLSVLRAFMGRLSMTSDNQGYVVSGITTAAKAMAVRYANSPSGAVWDAIANTADVGLAGTLQLFGAGMVIYLGVTKVLPATFGWLKKAATVASFTLGTMAHLAGVNNAVVSVDPVQLLRDWLKVDEKGQDERLNLFTIHSPHTSRAYAFVVLLRVLIRWYNTMADCLLRDSRGKICLLAVSELYRCRTIIMTAYNHALSLLTGSVSMCIVMNSANMDTNKSLYENYKAPANAPQVTEMKKRVTADDKRISDEMQLVLSMFRQACDKISEIDATHEDAGVTHNPDDIQLAFINYFEDNDLTTEILNRTAPTISPLAQIAARGAGVFCAMASQYIACMENTYGDLEHFALITKVDEKSTLVENASVMFSLTVVMDMLFMHELYLPANDPFLPHLVGVHPDGKLSGLDSPWLSSFIGDAGTRVSNAYLKKLLTDNVRHMELYMAARQLTSPYCTVMDYMASRASMFAFQNKIKSFMVSFDDRQKRRFAQRRTMQFSAFFEVYADFYVNRNAHRTLLGRMNAPTRYSRLSISSLYQMSHLYLHGDYMEWLFQPGNFNTAIHTEEEKVSVLSLDELLKRVSFAECMQIVETDKLLCQQLRPQLFRILLTFSNLVLPGANERLSLQAQLYECATNPSTNATDVLREYLSRLHSNRMAPRDIVRMLRFLAMALERSESTARKIQPRLLPNDVTTAFGNLIGSDVGAPNPYFRDCAIILYVCTLLRHQVGDMPLLYEAQFDDHARCVNGTVGPIDVDAVIARSVHYDLFQSQIQDEDDVAIPAVSSVTKPRRDMGDIKRGEPRRVTLTDQKRPDQYLRTDDDEIVLWTDMWNKFVALYISSTARVDMNTLLNRWDIGFEAYYSEYDTSVRVSNMATGVNEFTQFAIVLKAAACGEFENNADEIAFQTAAAALYTYGTTDKSVTTRDSPNWVAVKNPMNRTKATIDGKAATVPRLLNGILGAKGQERDQLWEERVKNIELTFKGLLVDGEHTKLCIRPEQLFVIALYFQTVSYFTNEGWGEKVKQAATQFGKLADAPVHRDVASAMDDTSERAAAFLNSVAGAFSDSDEDDPTRPTGNTGAMESVPYTPSTGLRYRANRPASDSADDETKLVTVKTEPGVHKYGNTGDTGQKGSKWDWLWWIFNALRSDPTATASTKQQLSANERELASALARAALYDEAQEKIKHLEAHIAKLKKENQSLKVRASAPSQTTHTSHAIVPHNSVQVSDAYVRSLGFRFVPGKTDEEKKQDQDHVREAFTQFQPEIADLLFLCVDTGRYDMVPLLSRTNKTLEVLCEQLSRKDLIYQMQHMLEQARKKRSSPVKLDDMASITSVSSAIDHTCTWSGVDFVSAELTVPLVYSVNDDYVATKMVIYVPHDEYQRNIASRLPKCPEFVYSFSKLNKGKTGVVKVLEIPGVCFIHRVANSLTNKNNLMLIVQHVGDEPSDDLLYYMENLTHEHVPFADDAVKRVQLTQRRPVQQVQSMPAAQPSSTAIATAPAQQQSQGFFSGLFGRN